MSGSTYFLKIADAETEHLRALAYGNLAEVSFVAKRHIKELNGSDQPILLRFTEVTFVGAPDGTGDTKRVITSIAADGDTVAGALKRKLAAEKRQQGEADPDQYITSAEAVSDAPTE